MGLGLHLATSILLSLIIGFGVGRAIGVEALDGLNTEITRRARLRITPCLGIYGETPVWCPCTMPKTPFLVISFAP